MLFQVARGAVEDHDPESSQKWGRREVLRGHRCLDTIWSIFQERGESSVHARGHRPGCGMYHPYGVDKTNASVPDHYLIGDPCPSCLLPNVLIFREVFRSARVQHWPNQIPIAGNQLKLRVMNLCSTVMKQSSTVHC